MRGFARATCALVALALIASCSSDEDSATTTAAAPGTAASPTTAAPAATDAPEETDAPEATDAPESTDAPEATDAPESTDVVAAEGEPVRIGFVNIEGGASTSLPQYRVAAEAVVEYANAELGGIAGRPIELVTCFTNGTPESTIACANQMVDEGVALVTLGNDANPGQLADIVLAAGLPYVTNTGNSTTELTNENSFAWTTGVPSNLAAYATYASGQGYGKVAILVIDNPAATGAVNSLGQGVFDKAGVELEVVPVAPGTPDMTPQLQAAIDSGAEMLGVLGDTTMCTAFYTAYQTLNAELPTAVGNACIGATVLPAAPDNLLEHLFVTQKLRLDEGNGEEGKLYLRVLDTYGSSDADATSPLTAAGYATVLGIVRMLDGLEGDVNAESIFAELRSATSEYPMAPGSELHCDSTAIPSLPRVCSSVEYVYQIMPDRTLEFVEAIDVAPLFAA